MGLYIFEISLSFIFESASKILIVYILFEQMKSITLSTLKTINKIVFTTITIYNIIISFSSPNFITNLSGKK